MYICTCICKIKDIKHILIHLNCKRNNSKLRVQVCKNISMAFPTWSNIPYVYEIESSKHCFCSLFKPLIL